MKNILITGGAGFIGSNLTRSFLKNSDTVTVIDNLLTGSKKNLEPFLKNNLFTFINVDLIKTEWMTKLTGQTFDYIFHLASPASPKQYFTHQKETLLVNSLGTYNILNFFKESSSGSFLYTSTSEVYGDPLEHPQKETYWGNVNPNGERSCYDEAKRFGEAMCMTFFRKDNLNIHIARLFNTYGPNMEMDDGRVVSNFITQALQNKDITVYNKGEQTRSFCYVDDMIVGLSLLSQSQSAGEVVNLGNSIEQKIINVAHIIKKIVGSSSQITAIPYPSDVPGDDPQRRRPDIAKAKKLFNFAPSTPFEEGIQKTVEYFKSRFDL
ncbi:hypothetical protein A3D80_01110 [Candidatus Roizmanbacteria bacterium RIFCSPHIGHO2_02_FULL_40_13b]|uniref:NAD-dependent epimerase/dehydratase domain-containing protein n=1 Tax=Candidatus Roizmanbacteria bacterium RIFCSPHIGHO2_01_FULL_39_24 TaxID=1802032 RepID=A0A1F7GL73_9BACT|nr:MAG: hypothetical protein A2799_01250 [Candidatus Roizmanbacteria bacterium RIFCSPHIGHO2_01_FULL_39_24]OGK26295.1 MAG: hypothetical protein A3D80_01110 [Candidatus Roizmanbacteria bacterium RIFCSPHIGHO2_02_FULL_40_13b]OGK49358.1 MAG: hypothetical protein A3A56_03740 [Candidatus Roizmanbacteria bacterium RIFCSPLOWO2_01_FULL_40_32]